MDSVVTDSPQQQPSRSFGLAELFVLLGIFAVSFACAFPSTELPNRMNPQSPFWKAFLAFPVIVTGVLSLGGASVVCSRWRREKRRSVDPGEWFLLICAARFLLDNMLVTLIGFVYQMSGGVEEEVNMFLVGVIYVQALAHLFIAGICVSFVARQKQWWWKVAFILFAISLLANAGRSLAVGAFYSGAWNTGTGGFAVVVNVVAYVVAAFAVITILWIAASLFVELWLRINRGRLHWIGIATLLLSSILPMLVYQIASRVLSIQELYPNAGV